MKEQHRRAGQSVREMADGRYKNRVWFVLGTTAIVLVILLVAYNAKSLSIGGIGLFGLMIGARLIMNYSDARTNNMIKQERRAIRGAKGEEKVGSLLQRLGEDYLVIHDIVSPFGNIDHIVINRQNAVYLIETKAHGGRVAVENGCLLVNGRDPEKDFVGQALNNTCWLRDKIQATVNIQVWVVPVLVFTNAFVERSAPIKGVKVINKKFLLKLLQAQNAKSLNPLIWESREKILKALSQINL